MIAIDTTTEAVRSIVSILAEHYEVEDIVCFQSSTGYLERSQSMALILSRAGIEPVHECCRLEPADPRSRFVRTVTPIVCHVRQRDPQPTLPIASTDATFG